jgi:intracellular multiplication protein IcmL
LSIIIRQIINRPLPPYLAIAPGSQKLLIQGSLEPNLLPTTILNWASKAAVTAYTFDFVNYNNQISAARNYFTNAGWQDYQASVRPLITNIVQNQLFVNGVVAGVPVISNQGYIFRQGYVWRVQIPFLVTYQSANAPTMLSYTVILTIVKVPTLLNKQGIGIDQFVMV